MGTQRKEHFLIDLVSTPQITQASDTDSRGEFVSVFYSFTF